MKLKFPRKAIKGDFVIIDSMFPQREPFGFRNTEINEYLRRIKSSAAYAMYPMEPWGDAWFPWSYGVGKNVFKENIRGYLAHYPENKDRVHYIEKRRSYSFGLAYSYFLAETFVLLPYYERNKIPFVFMLYPGGAFGLENKSSDAMLKRILGSPCFRRVIVSQAITRDYLLKKKFCTKERISYIYGGFCQFTEAEVKPKRYYKKQKNTFDVCFVAAKYSERGIDKGYDLFIETAKILSKEATDIRFHVVGNFTEEDIPVQELDGKVTFYGYQKKDFFPDFFAGMDVFVSPNRPGKLYEGSFDGFPIGIDAGYCETAMFVSDELNMNQKFIDGEHIVIIPLDAKKIASKILSYYNDTESLYRISKSGKEIFQNIFSINNQIEERLKVFNEVYEIENGRKLT